MRHVVRIPLYLFWGVSCALGARAVRAQPVGESDQKPRPKFITLDQIDAYLEFKADLSHTRVDQPSGQFLRRRRSQSNRERVLEEHIGFSLSGTVIDPKFITFAGEFGFALTQSHFEEKINSFERTDADNGHLLQYNLRTDFFRGKRLSGSLYGRRLDDRIDRRFQSTLNERRTGFGTSWAYSDSKHPAELTYDYLETDRTGNARSRDDEHFTESTLRFSQDWNFSEYHRLKYSYEHGETKQQYQGSTRPFETARDLFRITHEISFGPEHKSELRTVLHWQEESGDFARDLFEIGPRLTLHHHDHLQTQYQYQFNRERFEGLDIETQRLDFVLTHQLYTNLITTLNLFGLYEDVEDDVQTTQYGSSVDWQYNRRNPYGHLYANLALAYDTQNTRGGNKNRVVLNEAHVMRDPVAATLRNRNIVPFTIIVTDTSNRRLYRIGIDYYLFFQGNTVRITRIRSGRIADGDTILVDYLYKTPAGGTLDTIRVDFNIEQRFKNGLKPYYRLSYRNQEDDATTGFLSRADLTDHHRIGVAYDKDRYSLGVEYEIFDDTIEPFDAYHLDGLFHLIRTPDQSFDASARFSQFFFEGGFDKRDVVMVDVSLDHRLRLSDSVSTIQRLAYRLENDSTAGRTNAWDATTGVEYVAGDLHGEVTFEYNRLDLPESQEDDFGLYFRIRRELPNVLARR